MAYDPLSLATRKTRTSLLIFSGAALSIEIFDLRPTSLPVLGADVQSPQQFLPFLVGFGMILLLVTFSLYVYDDIAARPTKGQMEEKLDRKQQLLTEIRKDADELIGQVSSDGWSRNDSSVQSYFQTVYSEISHLQGKKLTLMDEVKTLEHQIENYSIDLLSECRFWIVDVGLPLALAALAIYGWVFDLVWFAKTVGIPQDSN